MRVGIDARPTQGRFTGDSTYWRGLIHGLSRLKTEHEFVVYLDSRLPDPQLPASESITVRFLQAASWRLWSGWSFPNALHGDRVDLAHVQYTIPPRMPCPVVTSIHDVSFKRHPDFFPLKDRLILDIGVKQSARKAARIIAISQATKSELIELYHISENKIAVVYPGVDEQFRPMAREEACRLVREKYAVHWPFVLTVGVIQPRKNLPRLLEAFSILKAETDLPHRLVITGKYGWKESPIEKLAADLNLTNNVILTGYVPYEDLPLIYNAADVFVYPSVYEGFGLPPLEAMACGTPVITGSLSSLPEVVGDAGIMVNPYDPKAFAVAMENILTDESLRQDLSRRGLLRSRLFTWHRMAEEMVVVYDESRSR